MTDNDNQPGGGLLAIIGLIYIGIIVALLILKGHQ